MATIGPVIYEDENFFIDVPLRPFVTRNEGGHIRLWTQQPIRDRTEFTPENAVKFIRLTMIIGESYQIAMNNQGIEVVRLNYQDMGNWAWKTTPVQPRFHLRIFGRAVDAVIQKFPESVQLPDRSSGFYDGFLPLTSQDIQAIQQQISIVSIQEKYQSPIWKM